MKKIQPKLLNMVKYFFFWLLFFNLERLVFILFNWHKFKGNHPLEIAKIFLYGLRMDASMAGYACALPLLATILTWFLPRLNWGKKALKIYTIIVASLFSLITITNVDIYQAWGTKINYKVIEYAIKSPEEAYASSLSSNFALPIFVGVVLVLIAWFLFIKLIKKEAPWKKDWLKKAFIGLLLMGVNFLAIRGGWQLSPINESMAYFSLQPIFNTAAINTEWSFLNNVLNRNDRKERFKYFKKEEAQNLVSEYYPKTQNLSPNVLNTKRPNLIVIIMESYTANVVDILGGEKGMSKCLDSLADNGILFNQIYSAGSRTDKGVIAVCSAFPAQAHQSIIKDNNKQVKLPTLSDELAAQSYSTMFLYGGESEFTNMKSYILSHNYQKLIDKPAFQKKDLNSKWGAFDGALYKKITAEINQAKAPFFVTALTLSNHEPFELPGNYKFKGGDIQNKFRSTAFYADSCLGAFVHEAKKFGWFKNTLFVVVADHGHSLPTNGLDPSDPRHNHIPLVFFGDVIKPEFRGKVISKIGGQTDIAKTLFRQMDIPAEKFVWSKDLLNPDSKDFAFFNWDDGFCMVEPQQTLSFDATGNQIVYKKEKNRSAQQDEKQLKALKAMMQMVYRQYLNY